ncbi:MAG: phosphoenolpyruvate--protein phosphotransferase [Candidatus Izemoplasmatales bacterium]|jgi:phosphotransferase system enzyme I (PtsI)|nr:phosphoenolpyruvate--protein phosphotransferase [Candidatus Izemoplasmatales bacterium]
MSKGLIASKGIAIGKVYIFEKEDIMIKDEVSNDITASIKELDDAIKKSEDELKILIESSSHGDIFDAHLSILQDIELYDMSLQIIKDEKKTAASAYQKATNHYIKMFDEIEDEYFKERALDIKDIQYRVLCHLLDIPVKNLSSINTPSIIVAKDLTPSDTSSLNLNFIQGIITETGGLTSHTAIIARSLDIPTIVGAKGTIDQVKDNDLLILDAVDHQILVNPDEETLDTYQVKLKEFIEYKHQLELLKDKKAETTDGYEVKLFANVGSSKDIDAVKQSGAEGIGLFRTEFLFMDSNTTPSLDKQLKAYEEIFNVIDPVIIRTLDIGGDKNLPYLTFDHEENPFLGHRAIRLCLSEKDLFKTQLKAILLGSKKQKALHLMIPMIARVDEIIETKKVIDEVKKELKNEKLEFQNHIKIGVMIEIPSAALNIKRISKHIDFISIGSNDLIQYLYAADRMNPKVSYLYEPFDPTLLELIDKIIKDAKQEGLETGLCGEIGSIPEIALLLTAMGIDEISITASMIPEVKQYIRAASMKDLKTLLMNILKEDNASNIKKLMQKYTSTLDI